MKEYIVLTLVVVISIAAHVWLFLWIKFRIDEAVVIKCLEDVSDNEPNGVSVEVMAESINYKIDRVAAICERSQKITCVDLQAQLWRKI